MPSAPVGDSVALLFSGRTCPRPPTRSHYDILSDIMRILDHGNIYVDTIFMIIIMHSFPNIEENLFFDNGGPHLHKHNMHIILQHFK